MKKPLFKSHFQVEVLKDENSVFLLSEKDSFVLNGEVFTSIAPLMDGNRSSHDIVDILSNRFSPAEVYYAFEIMKKKGYVTENTSFFTTEQKKFWDLIGLNTEDVEEKLKSSSINLIPMGNVNYHILSSILEKNRISICDNGRLTVVLADDYLGKNLEEINRKSLKDGRSWLIVKPAGIEPSMGPLFIPGKTACWKCLYLRYRANSEINNALFQKKLKNADIHQYPLPFLSDIIYHMSAMEIARWIIKGGNERLEDKIITFDPFSIKTHDHRVVKRPECSECGKPIERSSIFPIPVDLQKRRKSYTTDGDHRSCSPEETFDKYKHNISELTGIVRVLGKNSNCKDPVHVYFSGHNLALAPTHMATGGNSLRNLSAGKGMSDIQAKVSSLSEALERYAGLFRGDEYRIKSTFSKLGKDAIHPNDCMNYSKKQYENREILNSRDILFHIVPFPFNEDAEIDWTPLWSLSKREFKYLPTSYCYYGYRYKYLDKRDFFAWGDSNGCASGNTIEEAILHGFFELVERDAVSIWWYNRLRKPSVELKSFNHPYIEKLQDFYHSRGREIWVIDITTDFNIPVFAALTMKTCGDSEELIFAFGCHFDPTIALLRAVCELNQFIVIAFTWTRDEQIYNNDVAKKWWKTATVKENPYLLPDEKSKKKELSHYKTLATDNLLDDINLCNKIVEDLGMEMFVLDQTRPDVGLNVVKVIVPGMRHMWERFREGRLYDVPLEMGWLREKKKENELNPIGVFV